MEIIKFNVCHQEICTDREKLVSDTVGSYRCHFSFDSSWDGLNKVAVFVKGKKAIENILDSNNECDFADELLDTTGTIVVGVYGTKDGVRYPTIKSKMLIVREGIVDGIQPTPPSEEIWEQLLNMIVAETERATLKETILSEAISSESERAINAENVLLNALNEEIVRAKAREDEIEAKIPSHDNFATKEELAEETRQRLEADNNFTQDLEELDDAKADKSNTYTKQEVDEKISQSTPKDYEQVKEQVNKNKQDIADLETNKVNKEQGKGLSSNDFTNALKQKLDGLENYDDTQVREAIQDVASDVLELEERVDNLIDDNVIVENKTWSSKQINEADERLRQRIGEIEASKVPNVIFHGTPTINGSQVSGFSPTNYCTFPFLMNLYLPFVIKFAIQTGNDVVNQQNILDSDFGLAFAVRQSRFVIALSTNGTSWDLGEGIGSLVIQPNTSYLVKISWSGSVYEVAYSLDGGNTYVVDITKTSSSQLASKQMYIGVGENGATIMNSFGGIIDFKYASLSMNNVVIWLGFADIGLLTRLSVDLENIDEDGINKIKSIIYGIKDNLVKDGLVHNDIVLTDAEKLAIETWLGLSENYLTYYNEMPYQVNGDYVPAHKKYVDTKFEDYYTKSEVDSSQAKQDSIIDRTKRSLEYLWKKAKGIIYDEETIESTENEVTVPQGATPYSSLDMLGGNIYKNMDLTREVKVLGDSRKFNQMMGNYTNSSFRLGINILNNNGYITFSGISTEIGKGPTLTWTNFLVPKGHKVIAKHNMNLPDGDYFFDQYNSSSTYDMTKNILTVSNEFVIPQLYVANVNANYDNVYGYFMLFDLTGIYGAGNEPTTVEQFKEDFPLDYYSYDAGSIQQVSFNEETISGDETSQTITYPNNVVLNGINNIKDEIYSYVEGNELVTKKITRYSEVDLGSLDWKYGVYTLNTWSTKLDIKGDYISSDYQKTAWGIVDVGYSAYESSVNVLIVNNGSSTNTPTGKLVYGLATPTITEISRIPLTMNLEKAENVSTNNTSYAQESTEIVGGVLQYGKVDEIISKKQDSTVLMNKPIPQSVQNLDGYGWSAVNVYNYFEVSDSKVYFHKKVFERAYQQGDEALTNVLTDGFITYYQGEEVVTDITDMFPQDWEILNVEPNGTIEFHYPLKDGYEIDIPNRITYMVDVNEVA